MVPTINLILLVTPGRILDKRRDGWSSMLYLKKVKKRGKCEGKDKAFYVLLLLLLLMFMSRRCQAGYFTVAQALPIILPSISPSKRVNPVLLSLHGKASRCCFFHRYVIFNNKWNNHFFGFDLKGYKPMPNEAFPRIASSLGHTTGKGCTRAWIFLCNGYFIDCLFVVRDFFHVCIMSD